MWEVEKELLFNELRISVLPDEMDYRKKMELQ